MDITTALDFLKQNQLVAGGVLITAAGFVSNKVRSIPATLFNVIKRESFVTLEVTEPDDSCSWVRLWISKHFRAKRDFLAYAAWAIDRKAKKMPFVLLPAPGSHFGWYGRTPIWIQCVKENIGGNEGVKWTRAGYTITFLTRDRTVASKFMEEARELFLPDDNQLELLTSRVDNWTFLNPMEPRSRESIILPDGHYEELLADIKNFMASRDWYKSLGVPYRRGYLLYGVPGSGKSSLVAAIASELRLNIYILQLSTLSDSNMISLFSNIRENSIVLMEDIDCAFTEARKKDETKLTFSVFLNALDGIAATQSTIIMMTTNHIEKLDPALIRPGRIDHRLELKNADYSQALRIFKRFRPAASQQEAEEFALAYGNQNYSMSALQGKLLYGEDFTPTETLSPFAAARVKTLSIEPGVIESTPATLITGSSWG